MNVGNAAVGVGSLHRSKLTLTPLVIPPPSAPSHTETAGDHYTPAFSLETPGRPGSARLAPLRNPPQAPPVVVDHGVNLPDVERAPFVAQRFSAIDGSSSDSDDNSTFSIDLKPADHLLQPMEPRLASAGSSCVIGPTSPGIVSAVLLAPMTSPSQTAAADAHLPTSIRKPAPSSGASALDSGLSLREKQLMQLLSADEQGKLHSHALGSVPIVISGVRSSNVKNFNELDSSTLSSPHAINSQRDAVHSGCSSPASNPKPAPDLSSSVAAACTPSAKSLSRKGSDAHSEGSWDDDEAASGTDCFVLRMPQHEDAGPCDSA